MDFEKLLSERELNSAEIRRMIHNSLRQSIKGEFSFHRDYPVFCTCKKYHKGMLSEGLPLFASKIPDIVFDWAGIADRSITREDILVLDLETTGLSRGGGMLAFMIGLGYYEDSHYVVQQLFLPGPEAETNAFELLLPLLEKKAVLLTFNGKTFDLPILESRFLHNQIWIDLRSRWHIDALHVARRLWKNKVPSCALETLEYYILGQIREKELDIESELIPQTYFQFLISGETELLKRIFLHNQTDILHTAALFALICEQIDYPLPEEKDVRIDYHAVAKLYQSQKHHNQALQIMTSLIEEGFITPALVYDLGMLHKKGKRFEEAAHYFRMGADLQHQSSQQELCIILEQKQKDYASALSLSEEIYRKLQSELMQDYKKLLLAEKRINRLKQKLEKRAIALLF